MGTPKLRILVFENDTALQFLLKEGLQREGYDVDVYADPTKCSVYLDHKAECPLDSPCADIIISDQKMENISGVDFFLLQKMRGCKVLDKNKAIITAANMEPEIENAIEHLGCKMFRKPFKVAELLKWIDGCANRTHGGE